MSVPEILYNRAYLLTVIALITTISSLGPFFLEELATCAITEDEHGHIIPDEIGCLELVAHETLHIAAITFGTFLVILSIIAYRSTRNSNIVFTALAFVTFTVLSVFLLAEDLASDRLEHDEAVWVDVLLTIMIGFFAIGVFSNQKFKKDQSYN